MVHYNDNMFPLLHYKLWFEYSPIVHDEYSLDLLMPWLQRCKINERDGGPISP